MTLKNTMIKTQNSVDFFCFALPLRHGPRWHCIAEGGGSHPTGEITTTCGKKQHDGYLSMSFVAKAWCSLEPFFGEGACASRNSAQLLAIYGINTSDRFDDPCRSAIVISLRHCAFARDLARMWFWIQSPLDSTELGHLARHWRHLGSRMN